MRSKTPQNVVILAFDGSLEMSIAIPRDMFFAANRASRGQDKNAADQQVKRVQVVTQDGKPVTTFNGSQLLPDGSIGDVHDPDLIIISGIWSDISDFLPRQGKVIAWLQQQHAQGVPIASLHSGAFLLAEAGLLDGKVATTYWQLEEEFRARYPKVLLQSERKITSADKLYCSSGVGSGLEMAVYLIERIYGIETAQRLSASFLMDIPRQSPEFHLAFDKQKAHGDRQVLAAQQWLESNFSSDFLMEELADKVGLGLRSFMRRFKKATGDTPLNYLQRVRIETAKELLSNSSLSIDQVSYRVGYEDASYFSRLFKREVEKTPGEFRSLANQVKT